MISAGIVRSTSKNLETNNSTTLLLFATTPAKHARCTLGRRKNESADSILRETFKSLADFVPNFEQRTLTVWLPPLAVQAHNGALRHLYAELTATGTLFPGTELRLIYVMKGAA